MILSKKRFMMSHTSFYNHVRDVAKNAPPGRLPSTIRLPPPAGRLAARRSFAGDSAWLITNLFFSSVVPPVHGVLTAAATFFFIRTTAATSFILSHCHHHNRRH
jgi:hypothetical protein